MDPVALDRTPAFIFGVSRFFHAEQFGHLSLAPARFFTRLLGANTNLSGNLSHGVVSRLRKISH